MLYRMESEKFSPKSVHSLIQSPVQSLQYVQKINSLSYK